MAQRFKLDDEEYDIEQLTQAGKSQLSALKFVDERIKELINQKALLQRAKNSYSESLKTEMLADKAGFLF